MKAIKFITKIILAATLAVAAAACGQRKASKEAAQEPAPQPTTADLCLAAVNKYLTEQIGSNYPDAQYCITYSNYTDIDESNPSDIQILGDFWVEKYNLQADTLMFTAGGDHPGKMHLSKDAQGSYQVTAFDQVGDGSTFLPTAKAIFGPKFDAFSQALSNDSLKQETRRKAVGKYVKANNIAAKFYKDYGWPAISID
ncbi:MAG: hypothetical protein II636_00145 [Bacteroidales bacterium]|nr:hypothetical protein [Bacteroidales bacterium]MBQ3983724.1 hypothetical protein [Bacteroidales bacterium]